jgi:di/tricarboxylate transporter
MRPILSVLVLVAGVVLLILGLNSSGALDGGLGQIFEQVPSPRSLAFLIIGVLCLLYGGVGTLFSRK